MEEFRIIFYKTAGGKTPSEEIERAKRYRADYLRREGAEHEG